MISESDSDCGDELIAGLEVKVEDIPEKTRKESPLESLGVAEGSEGEVERERDQSGEVRMSQQPTGGFSMEIFMRMMAEMEANRDRRREEADRCREEVERQREERKREEMAEQRQRDRENQERILTQLQNQMMAMNGRVRPVADPVSLPCPAWTPTPHLNPF